MESSETTAPETTAPEGGEQSTDDLLRQVLEGQQQHRAEVADLRKQLDAAKAAPPTGAPAPALSEEELRARRIEEIGQHSHYCPGCGKLVDYLQKCFGRPEAPHPPIDVIPTDELHGEDTTAHTPAPNTGT